MPIIHKTCTQCKVVKPIDEFPPDRRNSDGKQGKCRACRATNQRAYITKHPERKRESDKRFRENHPEFMREKQRAYSANNRDRLNALSAQWRRDHRSRRNEIVRAYRARHSESYRVTHQRYQARKWAAEGACTRAEWEAILEQYAPEGRCPACGNQRPMTMDHIIPLSLGGTNSINNLQPLCNHCNAVKGQKIIDYRR